MKKNLIILAAVVMCLASGCKQLSSNSNNSIFANFKELSLVKGTGTPKSGDGKIKGKIAIVMSDMYKRSLDRFSGQGVFDTGQVEKTKNFFPPEIYAQNLDELGTLISVFETGEVFRVSIIDYKTKTELENFEYDDSMGDKTVDYYKTIDNTKDSLGNKKDSFLMERLSDYLLSLPNELSPSFYEKPIGETLQAKDILQNFQKSKKSLDQYKGKEITVEGYDYFPTDFKNSTLLHESANRDGESIFCQVGVIEALRFKKYAASKSYKIIVRGELEIRESLSFPSLNNCRLLKAEEAVEKKSK